MDAPPKPTVTAEREDLARLKKTISCRLLGVFATEPLIWQFNLLNKREKEKKKINAKFQNA